MAAAFPNLFLKWLAFRELLKPRQSNAEIATKLWGPDDGPSKFSKMLRGDLGCEPDIAAELAEVVNKRVAMVRGAKGRTEPALHMFRGGDFELPVFEFTRRLIDATEVIEPDELDRAHKALIGEFAPVAPAGNEGPHLAIEQFGTARFIEGAEGAAEGPPVFEIGRHKGLFAIDGLAADVLRRPIKMYVMFARDPAPLGARIWDVPFAEAIRWLPSPFAANVDGARVLLMKEPRPFAPVVGHFHMTVVLVHDEKAIGRLDPRGNTPPTQALDEEETARFLTNLNRVAKSHPNAMALCAGEYIVRQPKAA